MSNTVQPNEKVFEYGILLRKIVRIAKAIFVGPFRKQGGELSELTGSWDRIEQNACLVGVLTT